MHPDCYMPYYGKDFEQATKGLRREVKWSYLAALWHYWHHTHCSGLPDDDEYLMGICDCQPQDWVRTRGMIFGPHFKLSGDKWQNERMCEIYSETVTAYNNRVKGAAVARGMKVDNRLDTSVDINPDTNPAKTLQPEPDLSAASTSSESDAGIPTKAEVLDHAKGHGITELVASKFYDWHQGKNLWFNKHGKLINWRHELTVWQQRERSDTASKPRPQGPDRNAGTFNKPGKYGHITHKMG